MIEQIKSNEVQHTFKVDSEVDEIFRGVVFKRYGLNRGALQTALRQAMLDWIDKNE